jgi:hypothetical protein
MLEDDKAISCFTDDLGATSWDDDNGLTLTCGAIPVVTAPVVKPRRGKGRK